MSEVRFKLAAGTNVGLIRQNNEDNFVVCSDLSTSNWLIPQAGDYADLGQFGVLLVVADGMGGAMQVKWHRPLRLRPSRTSLYQNNWKRQSPTTSPSRSL